MARARGSTLTPQDGLRATLAAVAFSALAGCAATGPAIPETPGNAMSLADREDIAALEQAFWHCDYVATTQGVLAAPMAACRYATDELKARKFGGSFRALTQWWQENKAEEHRRRGR